MQRDCLKKVLVLGIICAIFSLFSKSSSGNQTALLETHFQANGEFKVGEICHLTVLIKTAYKEEINIFLEAVDDLKVKPNKKIVISTTAGKWVSTEFKLKPDTVGELPFDVVFSPAFKDAVVWEIRKSFVLDTNKQELVSATGELLTLNLESQDSELPFPDISSVESNIQGISYIDEDVKGNQLYQVGPNTYVQKQDSTGRSINPPDEETNSDSEEFIPSPLSAPEGFYWQKSTEYEISLSLETLEETMIASNLGVHNPVIGTDGIYTVSETSLENLEQSGFEPEIIRGVTNLVLMCDSGLVSEMVPLQNQDVNAQDTGNFSLSTGTDGPYPIPDYVGGQPGSYIICLQNSSGAPSGAHTTSLQYSLEIDDRGDPNNFYCRDYQVYLKTDETPVGILVYDNCGGRTDGGCDDDSADDSDIFIAWNTTHLFDGENPNQSWCVLVRDTAESDVGQLEFVEFTVFWAKDSPPPPPDNDGDDGSSDSSSSDDDGGSSSSKKKKLCFIATAAYGTPLAKEVKILCRFRDSYLLSNSLGQKLVSLYYKLSPPIANYIKNNAYLKAMVRGVLKPVVWLVDKFFAENDNREKTLQKSS